MHYLAQNNCYDAVDCYLKMCEKTGQHCRQQALSALNRKGDTAFALAKSLGVQSLLEWSVKQEGFYYLPTQPTVIVMYSSEGRHGFDEEVNKFVEFLKGDILRIDPIVVDANPTSYEIIAEIRKAQLQPSISALIVIYMSHGYRGYVETADHPLPIQDILDVMCDTSVKGTPKVGAATLFIYIVLFIYPLAPDIDLSIP